MRARYYPALLIIVFLAAISLPASASHEPRAQQAAEQSFEDSGALKPRADVARLTPYIDNLDDTLSVDEQRILDFYFSEAPDRSDFAMWTDERSGEIEVVTESARFAHDVQETFDVRVTESVADRFIDRIDDNPPFSGGARMLIGTTPQCTAGFTIDRIGTGAAGIVTAGHCGPEGTVFRNGLASGGTSVFGEMTVNRFQESPTVFDLGFVRGEQYRARIWTDPGLDSRPVINDWNAGVGDSICHSGFFSKQTCGMTVLRASGATFCAGGVCQSNLSTARDTSAPNRISVCGGDSGGPVFSREPGGNGARIHGVVVGGAIQSEDDPRCSLVLFYHRVGQVKETFNASVRHAS